MRNRTVMATKLLVPLLGLLVSVVIRQTSAGLTFSMLRDDRCFNYIPDYYLGNVFLPGIRSCAIYCASTDSCAMFMYTVENSSCSLYKGIVPSTYMSLTFSAPGQCKIGDVVSSFYELTLLTDLDIIKLLIVVKIVFSWITLCKIIKNIWTWQEVEPFPWSPLLLKLFRILKVFAKIY